MHINSSTRIATSRRHELPPPVFHLCCILALSAAFPLQSCQGTSTLSWNSSASLQPIPLCMYQVRPLLMSGPIQSRKRTKTFTGCWTCRKRKIKCDEAKPSCLQCRDKGLTCEGYSARLQWLTPATGQQGLVHSEHMPVGSASQSLRRVLPAGEWNGQAESTPGCLVIPFGMHLIDLRP